MTNFIVLFLYPIPTHFPCRQDKDNTVESSVPPKRRLLTLREKMEIVDTLGRDEKLSVRDLARKFNIGKTQAAAIVKNKDKIRSKWAAGENEHQKKSFLKSDGLSVDKMCFEWYARSRSENMTLTGPMVKAKAKEIAEQLGYEGFKASDGWLQKWRIRHNISFKPMEVETVYIKEEADQFDASCQNLGKTGKTEMVDPLDGQKLSVSIHPLVKIEDVTRESAITGHVNAPNAFDSRQNLGSSVPLTEAPKKRLLSLKEKMKIIDTLEKTKLSVRALAKKFNIGKTQAAEIAKNRDKIRTKWQSGVNEYQKNTPTFLDVDKMCFDWFVTIRSQNITPSGPMVKAKAKEIAETLGHEGCFKASNGWLQKWLKRHDIRLTDKGADREDEDQFVIDYSHVSHYVFCQQCRAQSDKAVGDGENSSTKRCCCQRFVGHVEVKEEETNET